MPQLFGWNPNPVEVDRVLASMPRPTFAQAGRPIRDSGKGKVVLLHDVLTKILGRFPIHDQAIGDCFVAGTMVSGETMKPIEDVKVGDRVWTADGVLSRVVSTRQIESRKPLVRVRATGCLPITCTADHRFLVYRMARVGGKRVNSATYQRAINGDASLPKAAVMACYESRCPEWVRAEDLTDTDCLLTPVAVEPTPVPNDMPAFTDCPDGWWLLGYFLGNGHASGGTVEIATPDEAFANGVADKVRACGLSCVVNLYRANTPSMRVRIHSRDLVETFRRHFYDVDGVKVFPAWAIASEEFLDGLRAADGSERDSARWIDSTSRSIVFGAVAALTMAGFEPTVSECVRSKGTYANAKPLYRVLWRENKERMLCWRDDRFVCRPVRSIEFIEGNATVYDIGVEDESHSFLANGVIVHNCVSHGWGLCVDILKAVEIALLNEPEQFVAETSTEQIYHTSRVDIGRGQLGNEDGSLGAWAAKAVTQYGVALRKKYANVDLTNYSGTLAKKWGAARAMLPADVDREALEHPVRTTSLVTTYEEARDAIANGYPVAVCSMVGFQERRDNEGFAKASGQWAHCMSFVAVDDAHSRPGLLCVNSWGPDWISGPKRHDQPEGSFWVDAATCTKMLRDRDSFALSSFAGYPARTLPENWLC